jgi:hypothetical protein
LLSSPPPLTAGTDPKMVATSGIISATATTGLGTAQPGGSGKRVIPPHKRNRRNNAPMNGPRRTRSRSSGGVQVMQVEAERLSALRQSLRERAVRERKMG